MHLWIHIFDANVDEIFAPAGIAAASWNGEMYAPPLNNSGQILYYNKDLLAKAGLLNLLLLNQKNYLGKLLIVLKKLTMKEVALGV